MVDQPTEINAVNGVEQDGLTFIADLNLTIDGETFDAPHVFREETDSAFAPWLLQEINNGNIVPVPFVPAAPTPAQVDSERDRRRELNITVMIDGANREFLATFGEQAQLNGAATWALKARDEGTGDSGDHQWDSNTEDFNWILADDSLQLLDAPEVLLVWAAIARRNYLLGLDARTIKNTPGGIPTNFTDNSFWSS